MGYDGDDRRNDDTRDIALKANTKVDQHMTDCVQFRIDVQKTLGEFREDIKKLNWRMALLMGGITAVSKLLDYYMPLHRG